jgi:TATA-binding protein-associated factor
LRSFFDDPELASEWMNADVLHLLYRNLVLEERPDIRGETMLAWNSALHVIRARPDFLATDVLPYVAGWLNICLTPISMPLEPHLFHQVVSRSSASTHDVDKSILRADFALVSPETILRNRVDAIIALAEITRYDTTAVCSILFEASRFRLTLFLYRRPIKH